jgi:hypothetical protein
MAQAPDLQAQSPEFKLQSPTKKKKKTKKLEKYNIRKNNKAASCVHINAKS